MMKRLSGVLWILGLSAATSCADRDPARAAFEEAKRQGNFKLIASTTIDGDRASFWKDVDVEDPAFGRFLISSRANSGELLDFCSGRFVSSGRPFFQSPRYVTLVASTGLGGERHVFFVYDARSKKFFTRSVGRVFDVHDNILILGENAFFSSCKTMTPVGRVNLTTGHVSMYGSPAPQSASFYVVGSNVFVRGRDNKTYRVDESELVEVDTLVAIDQDTSMSFDTISNGNKPSK